MEGARIFVEVEEAWTVHVCRGRNLGSCVNGAIFTHCTKLCKVGKLQTKLATWVAT